MLQADKEQRGGGAAAAGARQPCRYGRREGLDAESNLSKCSVFGTVLSLCGVSVCKAGFFVEGPKKVVRVSRIYCFVLPFFGFLTRLSPWKMMVNPVKRVVARSTLV
jgi:hypothetical protein